MAKHDLDNSTGQGASRHFDESLTSRIAGILAELEDSRFDESGVYIPDPVVDEKRPSASDVNVFGSWTSAGLSDARPSSRSEASSGKKQHADSSVNYVASNIQNARSYKYHGRAVELDYFGASVCKSCVEPTTYRYVHNNARYRSSKALVQKFGYQKATRRPTDARTLNPEQKKLQKEIQRELRREFGLTEERSHLDDREQNWASVARQDEEGSPTRTAHDGQSKEDDELSKKREVGDPERKKSGDGVGEKVKCSTPLVLPAIVVPLVKTDGRSNAVDISCIANQLEAFKNSGTDKTSRTKRGLYLGARSRSEPPPAAAARVPSGSADRTSLVGFEVVPTSLRRDITVLSALRARASADRRGKPCPEADALCFNKYSDGWTPRESTCLPLDVAASAGHLDGVPNGAAPPSVEPAAAITAGSTVANDKRKHSDPARTRKNSSSDGSDPAAQDAGSLSQIRYMAASGEVSNAPKFGTRSSEEIPTADLYSSVETERAVGQSKPVSNRSSNHADGTAVGEKIQNAMTTKFRMSLPNKHASKELASPKHKSQALKNNPDNLFTDFSSGKLVSGGLRAYPVGQVKIIEKKASDHPRPEDLDILPKISGRKVTMAVTSHRIV